MKVDKDIKSRYFSPLRYPGSKKKIAPYIHSIMVYNRLDCDVFAEPFAGGASVSLYFLVNKLAGKIIIADVDPLIYSFWHTLFFVPQILINFVKRVDVNLSNFRKYKTIASNAEKHEKKELAKACLFLNRTSFSGILKENSGPIGGKEQKSDYAIDCRFNREVLVEKIENLSRFKNRVDVLPYDWIKTIKHVEQYTKKKNKHSKPFFYFDPPFFRKANNLYRYYFRENEHKNLCKRIISLASDWILSYDNVLEIEQLYSQYKNMHIAVPYSINSDAKRIEKELIITPLSLPKM